MPFHISDYEAIFFEYDTKLVICVIFYKKKYDNIFFFYFEIGVLKIRGWVLQKGVAHTIKNVLP